MYVRFKLYVKKLRWLLIKFKKKKRMKYMDSVFSDKLKCKVMVKMWCISIFLELLFECM